MLEVISPEKFRERVQNEVKSIGNRYDTLKLNSSHEQEPI